MAVDLAQKAQNFTNRGRQALETGRYELAVDMLMEAVSAAPDVLETRRLLRAAQIANFRKNGKAGFGAKLGYKMAQMKIMGLVKKGRGVEAMAEAEKLLCQNPLDPDNIEAAVKAAEAAGKADHAAITVEAAYECSNRDPALLERVATYYTMAKRYDKARDAYQKLSELKPGDQRVLQLLKNTEAQATMNAGWEQTAGKKGGFQALIANKEQAKKLDQANKAVITGDDADALIKEKLDQIAREPKNMNFRRALARIYVQNKRFEEAIQCLTDAIEAAGSMDPELDRMLSQTYVSYYDQQIEAYRAAGDEENAIEMENQKNQFVFDDLAQRGSSTSSSRRRAPRTASGPSTTSPCASSRRGRRTWPSCSSRPRATRYRRWTTSRRRSSTSLDAAPRIRATSRGPTSTTRTCTPQTSASRISASACLRSARGLSTSREVAAPRRVELLYQA